MGQRVLVGIAEIAFSSDSDIVLSAPNLGSCLGIAVYDVKRQCGGMIHCLLPLSKGDPSKAQAKPAMYVDSGMTLLLETMFSNGTKKSELIISVAGGARIQDDKGIFDIGKKNHTIMRRLAWKNNILINNEHVGGADHRTVNLNIATGEVTVKVRDQMLSYKAT